MKNIYSFLPKHKKILDTTYHRLPHYIFVDDSPSTVKI